MREPALIFDFGNVVCHFDYSEGVRAARLAIGSGRRRIPAADAGPGFRDAHDSFRKRPDDRRATSPTR